MTNNPIGPIDTNSCRCATKEICPLTNRLRLLSFNRYWLLLMICFVLIGCSTTQSPVPVVDRVKTDSSGLANKSIGASNLSNQFYIVQKGDTLYSIALNHGIDFKKLAEWNNIADPRAIRPGQKISLAAPTSDSQPVLFALPQQPIETTIEPGEQPFVTAPEESEHRAGNVRANLKTSPKALKLPFSEQNVARLKYPENSSPTLQVPVPASSQAIGVAKNSRIEAAPQPELRKSDKAVNQSDSEWIWPTTGKLLSSFSKNSKGVKISGQSGQPILASAAGEIVYSGHGLRGYGNLIIIKHNNTFLSAYAHNSKLLVKEGETVTKGQKIAEMGNTDSDTIQLHFEIRKHGKPVDPLEYLPNQS